MFVLAKQVRKILSSASPEVEGVENRNDGFWREKLEWMKNSVGNTAMKGFIFRRLESTLWVQLFRKLYTTVFYALKTYCICFSTVSDRIFSQRSFIKSSIFYQIIQQESVRWVSQWTLDFFWKPNKSSHAPKSG